MLWYQVQPRSVSRCCCGEAYSSLLPPHWSAAARMAVHTAPGKASVQYKPIYSPLLAASRIHKRTRCATASIASAAAPPGPLSTFMAAARAGALCVIATRGRKLRKAAGILIHLGGCRGMTGNHTRQVAHLAGKRSVTTPHTRCCAFVFQGHRKDLCTSVVRHPAGQCWRCGPQPVLLLSLVQATRQLACLCDSKRCVTHLTGRLGICVKVALQRHLAL
jgi:hypothetical protein